MFSDSVRQSLLTSVTLNKELAIGLDRMYLSVHDAVVAHATSLEQDSTHCNNVNITTKINRD